MPSLIHVYDTEIERFCDSATEWLDEVYGERETDHRKLLSLEENLETLLEEIYDLDRSVSRDFTPCENVAAHRLNLRLEARDERLYDLWTQQRTRHTSRRALRGIHERYLGTVTGDREATVVFEVTRVLRNRDFCGYVEAHRVEQEARVAERTDGRFDSVRVVEGPLWVHDLFANLAGDGPRGKNLRSHYLPAETDDSWSVRARPSPAILVGKPCTPPSADVLETALRLWTPEENRAPYARFHEAFKAARLL